MITGIQIDNHPEDWNKVEPNFIYNRFDIMYGARDEGSFFLLKVDKDDGKTQYIPCHLKADKTVELGCWLTKIEFGVFKDVSRFILRKKKGINAVHIERALISDGRIKKHNDFHIDLPETPEELDARLSSKGRYNLRREKRIATDRFGCCRVKNLKAYEDSSVEYIYKFFKYKEETQQIYFNMTPEDYLRRGCITDIYILEFGERDVAIVLSCEQTEYVYCENMSYDMEMKKYSPGQILYDLYLKELIKKRKRAVFLLGGDNEYKHRWGGIEQMVSDYTIFRTPMHCGAHFVKSVLPVYVWSLLSEDTRHIIRRVSRKLGIKEFSSLK